MRALGSSRQDTLISASAVPNRRDCEWKWNISPILSSHTYPPFNVVFRTLWFPLFRSLLPSVHSTFVRARAARVRMYCVFTRTDMSRLYTFVVLVAVVVWLCQSVTAVFPFTACSLSARYVFTDASKDAVVFISERRHGICVPVVYLFTATACSLHVNNNNNGYFQTPIL